MLKNLTIMGQAKQFRAMFKLVAFNCLILTLTLTLSACGLISAKPATVIEADPFLEEVETQLEEANADVASIDKTGALKNTQLGNVALRLLSLEQHTDTLNQSEQQYSHGYYWLDGLVKRVQHSDDPINKDVNWIEVESLYDGENYIVTANSTLLDSVKVGHFVYLDGFYDTFSGFVATEAHNVNDLLEAAVLESQQMQHVTKTYDFGQVTSANKRKQVIVLAEDKETVLNDQTSFYDAYSKQAMTKKSFWRALSEDDTVFLIASTDFSTSDNSEQALDTQGSVTSVWLLDEQASNRAVIGTVKQVNDAATQIVLVSDMWSLKDNGLTDSQVAEVSLRLGRKAQLISSDGRVMSERDELVPGQHVVVEGVLKNRLLEAERLYLKAEKDLPVYAYGTVTGHQLTEKTIDLTVEWMFGSKPSKVLEVTVNDFTEMFESGDDKVSLSSTEFWHLLSINDDIEVEGQIVGNTLQASRLFLGNKELEVQTLSGTVEFVQDENIALRLYSYIDTLADSISQQTVLDNPSEEFINVRLASDISIQDIHLAESIVVNEFWERLEPADQLTVTGYFENNSFVAKSVKFEDEDTTPFVFGEVEAFEVKSKEIMLKGKNQVVVVSDATTINHTTLGKLSATKFWDRLNVGDNIDIEGSYKEGVFVAKKVFLSSKPEKDTKLLEGEILAFNVKTSSLQVQEADGFVVNVSISKDSVLLAKNGKLYSQGGFWTEIAIGQQISVEGERLGSIMQANYITLDKTPAKKDSIGFFDWLNM